MGELEKTERLLVELQANRVEDVEGEETYLDTHQLTLLRKGAWLRKSKLGEKICWQLRELDGDRLKVVTDEEESFPVGAWEPGGGVEEGGRPGDSHPKTCDWARH